MTIDCYFRLFLLACHILQFYFSDKWIGYNDYSSHDYGSYGNYDTSYVAKFTHETVDHGVNGRLGNGLSCFHCHGRLKYDEIESVTNNAWINCANDGDGGVRECLGDQRVCLTEERRRNDIVVEVKAMCKNPEACMYQWRRNQRYMPFFHLGGDFSQSGTAPGFFDDECRISESKFDTAHGQRSQWESVCRHCCKAVPVADATNGCNAPDQTTATPMGFYCASSLTCPAALLGAPSTNFFAGYVISGIQTFIQGGLHHSRAHPGDGRNSLPEDKFVARADLAGGTLAEQADRLSTEDTDFHNHRVTLGDINGAFGSK